VGSAESQRIFYELVLPGEERVQRGVLRRTNVIFRRRALNEIRGIVHRKQLRGLWTSIELHAAGWRSVFIPETLARGLSPDSLLPYFKQQFRWAYGAFEVLLRGGLFGRKGLTMDQPLPVRSRRRQLPALGRRGHLHVPSGRVPAVGISPSRRKPPLAAALRAVLPADRSRDSAAGRWVPSAAYVTSLGAARYTSEPC
jgi:hypothetical protein